MDILSVIFGVTITLGLIGFVLFLREKIRTKRNLKPYHHTDLDSSVENAKTLLNAADYIHATENNAIAAIWRCRRCIEHASINGNVYAIKGSWALKKKMIKVGPDGYLTDITLPRSCGCYLTYIYNLRSLPDYMLTVDANKILNK